MQESIELNSLYLSPIIGNSSYCWQVRYRDSSLGWSIWSEPLIFTTSESQFTHNLLINSDAELGVDNWTVVEGYFESLEAYECDGVEPNGGNLYFAVGALCNSEECLDKMFNLDKMKVRIFG